MTHTHTHTHAHSVQNSERLTELLNIEKKTWTQVAPQTNANRTARETGKGSRTERAINMHRRRQYKCVLHFYLCVFFCVLFPYFIVFFAISFIFGAAVVRSQKSDAIGHHHIAVEFETNEWHAIANNLTRNTHVLTQTLPSSCTLDFFWR